MFRTDCEKGIDVAEEAFNLPRVPAIGDTLDGYRLLRPIGRGGFGEVWLARVEATGEFKAFKLLSAFDPAHLDRELAALIQFRSSAANLQCPQLVPIEHVNRTQDGLFYVMPLADGLDGADPADPLWQPKTLAALIARQRKAGTWFSRSEICKMILPIIEAVNRLSEAGVVHRDIKPENILFLGGRPCLGDISLLTADDTIITRRGTPGYAAPSWYLESGGNPDLWGLATTLYSLVTGNAPDKIGRAAFLWPPQGESSVDSEEWNTFHRLILRATHAEASERFLRVSDFASAINSWFDSEPKRSTSPVQTFKWLFLPLGALVLGVCAYLSFGTKETLSPQTGQEHNSPRDLNSGTKEILIPQFEQEFASTRKMLQSQVSKPKMPIFLELTSVLISGTMSDPEDANKILGELERLLPAVREELRSPNQDQFNKHLEALWEVAGDAEEKYGRKVWKNLDARIATVQSEAGHVFGKLYGEQMKDQERVVEALSAACSNMEDLFYIKKIEAQQKKMDLVDKAMSEEMGKLIMKEVQIKEEVKSIRAKSQIDDAAVEKKEAELSRLEDSVAHKSEEWNNLQASNQVVLQKFMEPWCTSTAAIRSRLEKMERKIIP